MANPGEPGRKKEATISKAAVTAIRKARRPLVSSELRELKNILERVTVPRQAISNEELANKLLGKIRATRLGAAEAKREAERRKRLIRKRVHQLRRAGYPIALALGTNGGYFWATADKDSIDCLRRTSEMFDRRADTSHQHAARLVGLGLVEYQAQRAAARIDTEQERETQESALRQFVERVTRNPMTRKIFARVLGERLTDHEKAKLLKQRQKLIAERQRIRKGLRALLRDLDDTA
ncbi:MAG: hypothetical protein HQ592_07840 [Planctomycetes bacterium]|nr:hypothetical protein [Planctomycetota bacterium]